MEGKKTCVVCGEAFWRVLQERPTTRPSIGQLLCFECIGALEEGPAPEGMATLEARNRLAPWCPPTLAAGEIELMPVGWKE